MYTEEKCIQFFDNLKTKKHIVKDFAYEEYMFIKTIEESLQKESVIKKLYENNPEFVKNNNMVQFYLMGLKSTPIEILEDIINEPMSAQVLLKALENHTISEHSSRDKIYFDIQNALFDDTIKEHLYREIKPNNSFEMAEIYPLFARVTGGALDFLCKQLNFVNTACNLITDNRLAEEILDLHPDNEEIRTSIANNFRLSENVRNRAFNEGCIYEKITHTTDQMSSSMYESAIETLSMIDKVDEPIFQYSKRVITNLIQNNQLSESQQLDIVMRYANDKKTGYSWILDTLKKMTVYPSVFQKIVDTIGDGDINSVYIRDIFFSDNVPDKLLKERAKDAVKSLKGSMFISVDAEKLISKAISQKCIKDKTTYQTILDMNHYGFMEALTKDPYVPNDILRQIINKTINTNKSYIAIMAALNIGMNVYDTISGKKRESLYFEDVIKSITQPGPVKIYEIIHDKNIKFNIPVFAHNVFNVVNREGLIKYFKDAKSELKENVLLQNFMDKFINRYNESFAKDEIYTKLNLKVNKFSGEQNECEFDIKSLKDIYCAPTERLETALNKLSIFELSSLQNQLINKASNLQNIDSFVISEMWINFYKNIDNYIRINDTISDIIQKKEKEIEKECEIDER